MDASGASDILQELHIVSLRLQNPVADGMFLDGVSRAENGQSVLRIIYEDTAGKFRQAMIFYRQASIQPEGFRLEVYGIESKAVNRDLHLYHPGSSGRTLLCVTQYEYFRVDKRRVFLARLRLPAGGKESDPLGLDEEYTELSTNGLPLLHLLSGIDFDDGCGQILIGNLLGDVRLASFLPRPMLSPESISQASIFCKNDNGEHFDVSADSSFPLRRSERLNSSPGVTIFHCIMNCEDSINQATNCQMKYSHAWPLNGLTPESAF